MAQEILKKRHFLLILLLLAVFITRHADGWGKYYAAHIYPIIASFLSTISGSIPFAVGDLFIAFSLAGIIIYPFYACLKLHKKWVYAVARDVEYLLWIYVWFYIAWGLNYSQPEFYQRSGLPQAEYTSKRFMQFVDNYIDNLNASYTPITTIDKEEICKEAVRGFHIIADTLCIHCPFDQHPHVKTMLFSPLVSMVGVSGSMGPFFCEFTINRDVPPSEYAATYAHELSHMLGITSEAEANFYAFQVCIRSEIDAIRFSGYFSILGHVLSNARRLLDEKHYKELVTRIRPEIRQLAIRNQAYWQQKYSPWIGRVQDWMYDLYLKGNNIESGRKNYSEVLGLLISYEEWKTETELCEKKLHNVS